MVNEPSRGCRRAADRRAAPAAQGRGHPRAPVGAAEGQGQDPRHADAGRRRALAGPGRSGGARARQCAPARGGRAAPARGRGAGRAGAHDQRVARRRHRAPARGRGRTRAVGQRHGARGVARSAAWPVRVPLLGGDAVRGLRRVPPHGRSGYRRTRHHHRATVPDRELAGGPAHPQAAGPRGGGADRGHRDRADGADHHR